MSRLGRGGRADSLAGFRPKIKDEEEVPAGLLKAARKSGQLNLSGRALTKGNASVCVYVIGRGGPARARRTGRMPLFFNPYQNKTSVWLSKKSSLQLL